MPKTFKNPERVTLPERGQEWYQDAQVPALFIRASRRGKVYVLRRRVRGGESIRHVIGAVGAIDLSAARLEALHASERMARGSPPSRVRPVGTPKTFGELRTAYLHSREFRENLKPRSRTDYERKLSHPVWRPYEHMALDEITRPMLMELCDRLARQKRAYANLIRPGAAMFTWAVDRQIVTTSPFVRLRLPRNRAAPRPLSPEDMLAAFRALDAYSAERRAVGLDPGSWPTIYRLCAYSGQRPTTWADARWGELDAGFATMSVPPLRSKNGRPFSVAIAPQVEAILCAMTRGEGASSIFPDALNGDGVSDLQTPTRDRIATLANVPGRLTPWRFRSTFATTLRGWGVANEVIDRLQGRVSGQGIIAHYVADPPSPGDRELMARYADAVDDWVRSA